MVSHTKVFLKLKRTDPIFWWCTTTDTISIQKMINNKIIILERMVSMMEIIFPVLAVFKQQIPYTLSGRASKIVANIGHDGTWLLILGTSHIVIHS